MNKRTKLKILRKALNKEGYSSEYLESFDDLGKRVEDEPTEFIETCIEEAYKEGLNDIKNVSSEGGKK